MECGRQGRFANAANILSEYPRFLLEREEAEKIVYGMQEQVEKTWYSTALQCGVSVKDDAEYNPRRICLSGFFAGHRELDFERFQEVRLSMRSDLVLLCRLCLSGAPRFRQLWPKKDNRGSPFGSVWPRGRPNSARSKIIVRFCRPYGAKGFNWRAIPGLPLPLRLRSGSGLPWAILFAPSGSRTARIWKRDFHRVLVR